MNNSNTRRHFAIRAAISKNMRKVKPTITLFGRSIEVTKDNEALVEIALEADAQAAYAAASENAVRLRERQARAAIAA